VFAIGALRPDPTPAADETPSGQPSPIASLTGEPRITADIPLADPEVDHPIGGVAVGAESAWVGLHRRGESGAVARIDFQTNEVLTEIPVRKTPYRKQIAATDDAVWVASTGQIVPGFPLATGELTQRLGRSTFAFFSHPPLLDVPRWGVAKRHVEGHRSSCERTQPELRLAPVTTVPAIANPMTSPLHARNTGRSARRMNRSPPDGASHMDRSAPSG
jgi:hypothetical protein